MTTFRVDTRDVTRIAAGFDRAGARWREELQIAGQQSGAVVVREVRNEAPVREGTLFRSIGPAIVTRIGAVGIRINVPIKALHAKWVIGGRGAVTAIRAKALRFVVGGVVIYRKRVGPAKANDFPARGFAQARAQVLRLHQDALRRVIAQVTG